MPRWRSAPLPSVTEPWEELPPCLCFQCKSEDWAGPEVFAHHRPASLKAGTARACTARLLFWLERSPRRWFFFFFFCNKQRTKETVLLFFRISKMFTLVQWSGGVSPSLSEAAATTDHWTGYLTWRTRMPSFQGSEPNWEVRDLN